MKVGVSFVKTDGKIQVEDLFNDVNRSFSSQGWFQEL